MVTKGEKVPIRLISVPYHLGRPDVGMGEGPRRLLGAGAVDRLQALGHDVDTVSVAMPDPFEHEIGAYFGVQRELASHVATAVREGRLPFVLGGNCGCVLGSVAGVGAGDQGGVVWFDAHGDVNTPETTASGFLDGMTVAVLTGHAWKPLAASLPGFAPLPSNRVVLAGIRSIDEAEGRLIQDLEIPLVPPGGLITEHGGQYESALERLIALVGSVHIHVDLDVIDLADGVANEYAAPDGPPLSAVSAAIRRAGQVMQVNSLSLTSYNPRCDANGAALASALVLIEALAAALD